ncbi:MAG: cation-translocating P-type ATPase [Candidatus Woesearchaeota archaeon]
MGDHYYQKTVEQVYSELQTNQDGIKDAPTRQAKYGLNEFVKTKKKSLLWLFFEQFGSSIVWILLIAVGITYIQSHYIETIVLLIIIAFIVLLNFAMEYGASKSMEALLEMTPKMTKVIRDGKRQEILAKEVTVGDIIVLTRGGFVPADARLILANELQVDESALTGESVPVTKHNKPITEQVSLSEQHNMVFSGTHITAGSGLAVVVQIGEKTEFGKISTLLKNVEQTKTVLQRRLDKLTKQISLIAICISIGILFIGLYNGFDLPTMLIFSMAIIVAAIPESLPMVVAITLATGVRKMASQNAIVKKIPAVETLGTCSVICSDKTGTITQNKMVVHHIFTGSGEYDVSGDGYTPEGSFTQRGSIVHPQKNKTLLKLFETATHCNNSDVKYEEDQWIPDGEPTECALIVAAKKARYQKGSGERLKEFTFNSTKKCMSVVVKEGKGVHSFVKGAPEVILQKSTKMYKNGRIVPLTKVQLHDFQEANQRFAIQGLRVLALAYKPLKSAKNYTTKQTEEQLILVGLVAIRDPPEPTARDAILECQQAGIRVVMITGDNEVTAKSIAAEVGIFQANDIILTGKQLDEYDMHTLESLVDRVSVFARVTPAHKLKIVQVLQKRGHVVAMTGDGVNDAPALKKSDIGIAMGRSGTDVAKEASELVLKDDNFATIARAVEYGRTIYENIRKFMYYLLVGNFSVLLILLISSLVGSTVLPLTALMVLFINLITNEFPAIGLSFEKPHPHTMKQRPRDPKEGILSPYLWMNVISLVPLIVLSSILLYTWAVTVGDLEHAQTLLFVTIILFMSLHAFNARSWNESIIDLNPFTNLYLLAGVAIAVVSTIIAVQIPFFNAILGTVPLTGYQWFVCFLISLSILIFVEFKKMILKIEFEEMKKTDPFHTRR